MTSPRSSCLAWTLFISAFGSREAPAAEPPVEWVDPDTGHRVVRLSERPGTASLYFHQHPYSVDGRKVVVTTADPRGIATITLETRQTDQVVEGRVQPLVVGRKTGDICYIRESKVWAANLETHAERQVASLPPGLDPRGNVTVNADETLIAGIGRPNVSFTPDGLWVVFRSNRHGATHTYAVEVAGHGSAGHLR